MEAILLKFQFVNLYFASFLQSLVVYCYYDCDEQICYIDALMEDCSISTANALEILQSCTKPSKWMFYLLERHIDVFMFNCDLIETRSHVKIINKSFLFWFTFIPNLSMQILITHCITQNIAIQLYICHNSYNNTGWNYSKTGFQKTLQMMFQLI